MATTSTTRTTTTLIHARVSTTLRRALALAVTEYAKSVGSPPHQLGKKQLRFNEHRYAKRAGGDCTNFFPCFRSLIDSTYSAVSKVISTRTVGSNRVSHTLQSVKTCHVPEVLERGFEYQGTCSLSDQHCQAPLPTPLGHWEAGELLCRRQNGVPKRCFRH